MLKLARASILTGRSTLTSVPSSNDTRQVITDLASPAAGMWVVARWASLNLLFSVCLRMDRRPRVRRRKLNIVTAPSPRKHRAKNHLFWWNTHWCMALASKQYSWKQPSGGKTAQLGIVVIVIPETTLNTQRQRWTHRSLCCISLNSLTAHGNCDRHTNAGLPSCSDRAGLGRWTTQAKQSLCNLQLCAAEK